MGAFVNIFANPLSVRKGVFRGAVDRHPTAIAGAMRTKNATPMSGHDASPSLAFRVLHSRLNILVRVLRTRHPRLQQLTTNELARPVVPMTELAPLFVTVKRDNAVQALQA
jgi:hypothetical protein